jgi:hypothetical protein
MVKNNVKTMKKQKKHTISVNNKLIFGIIFVSVTLNRTIHFSSYLKNWAKAKPSFHADP